MHKNSKILIFLTAFLTLVPMSNLLYSQFGKNKVQYKNFDWKFIQSKHFDVYYYQGGYDIAEFAANVAEESLSSLTKNLDYNIFNRIPLIVFLSHNDFQQNNILDEFLPEGVGGVTEMFKNRVLVPYEGNYEQFRHVIHHELLHAFMNDMYYGGSLQNIVSKNITLAFPNWFNEGMAETQSLGGLDKETDMYIRDLVVNNLLYPIEYADGYLAYREGQSFFSFLMDYYGSYKLGELMNNIKTFGSIDAGFKETFKLGIDKLSEKWQKEISKIYWSDAKGREEVWDFSKPLTDHIKDGGFYNIAPVISPKGDKFVFISNRDDFFDIFLADANTGQIIDKLVEGNTSNSFEELMVLTPGLTWSPDGNTIAVSSKAGDGDAITLINVYSGNQTKLPVQLASIQNVAWSPKADVIAFVGTNGKQSDIYTFDLKSNNLINLTNDIFSDANPVWSPDGKFIYFNSDRKNYLSKSDIPSDFNMSKFDFNDRDIYKIEVSSKTISRVVEQEKSRESIVQFTSDGRMLYISDRSGINNLYTRISDSTGKFTDKPITNSFNPITQISLSSDGKKLLFVALNKGGYDIFSMENPFNRNSGLNDLELTAFQKRLNGMKPNLFDSSIVKIDSVKTTDSDIVKNDSLKIYGNDISIFFKNNHSDTVKKITIDTSYLNNPSFSIEDNQNSDGSYIIKDYKIKFSPDLVYGNAAYSNFYGVQGVAQISLSDLLGNHRIYLMTSMVIDLKNSDYAAAYYYMPKRIDYGFELYHTARFVYFDNGLGNGEELYRYRNYGGNISASFPVTRFKRLEGALSLMNVSQENLDNANVPIQSKLFVIPSVSYVFDNSLWGYLSPIKGQRLRLTALASPKLGSDGLEFYSLMFDYRKYIKFGDLYSFAFRFASGASFGANPQRFFIGGTENWINREYENRSMPFGTIEEYAFSMPGLPLRGYNYDRMSGSKYALTNLELRFPFFRYLILGLPPIGFQDIMGNVFLDAGTAWKDDKALKLFGTNESGNLVTQDLLLGTGFGTRIVFMGIPFKFDVAWSFNFQRWSPPKYYFSLGLDF